MTNFRVQNIGLNACESNEKGHCCWKMWKNVRDTRAGRVTLRWRRFSYRRSSAFNERPLEVVVGKRRQHQSRTERTRGGWQMTPPLNRVRTRFRTFGSLRCCSPFIDGRRPSPVVVAVVVGEAADRRCPSCSPSTETRQQWRHSWPMSGSFDYESPFLRSRLVSCRLLQHGGQTWIFRGSKSVCWWFENNDVILS